MTDSDDSDEETDERGTLESNSLSEGLLRDPIVAASTVFRWVLEKIDTFHAEFELLPGWVQFGFGVASFLTSAYFGATIRKLVNVFVISKFVSALEVFTEFALGLQLTLLLALFLAFQSSVANQRLKFLVNIVKREGMDSDDVISDGGVRTIRFDSSEAGAVGGAAFGAVFGGLFGYISTVFGGMIFGAIVGNLIEEWSVRRKNRRRVQSRIVSYLLRERIFDTETVEVETIQHWFPADDASLVADALAELLGERESPVVRASNEEIQLTDAAEAVTYLDRNGGHVPPAFEGPNRPH